MTTSTKKKPGRKPAIQVTQPVNAEMPKKNAPGVNVIQPKTEKAEQSGVLGRYTYGVYSSWSPEFMMFEIVLTSAPERVSKDVTRIMELNVGTASLKFYQARIKRVEILES